MKNRKGFTLIELIVVLGIIAILIGAAVPRLEGYVQREKESRRVNQEEVLNKAIIQYYALTGKYPPIVHTDMSPLTDEEFRDEIIRVAGVRVDTGLYHIEFNHYDSDHKIELTLK